MFCLVGLLCDMFCLIVGVCVLNLSATITGCCVINFELVLFYDYFMFMLGYTL